MRPDRILALRLRHQGKSYKEITDTLNIPKGTLSNWFRKEPFSEQIKADLVLKSFSDSSNARKFELMRVANKIKWDKWHMECREIAKNEFPQLVDHPLFVAGLMLYWGEGDKSLQNGQVRLVNTDPEIIRIFYRFLQDALGIPLLKIAFRLTIYPDLTEELCIDFWSRTLDVSPNHFRKSVTIQGRHPTKRLSYGMCSIEVYSRMLKEKMMVWIALAPSIFVNQRSS